MYDAMMDMNTCIFRHYEEHGVEEKETTQPCTEHIERIKNIISTIEELNDCKDDTMSPPKPKCQAALDAYFTLEDCNKAISRRKDSSPEEQDLLKKFCKHITTPSASAI